MRNRIFIALCSKFGTCLCCYYSTELIIFTACGYLHTSCISQYRHLQSLIFQVRVAFKSNAHKGAITTKHISVYILKRQNMQWWTKYSRKSKKIKQNWTSTESFDIYFKVIFHLRRECGLDCFPTQLWDFPKIFLISWDLSRTVIRETTLKPRRVIRKFAVQRRFLKIRALWWTFNL